MKGNYYFFELEDCSLPGIASGTLKYLGTKTDFKKLLQGTGPEMKELRNTFNDFCAGNQTIKHNVAYSEQRFASPVKVLKRRKISKGPSVYNHLNAWGFPYDVITDATELTICLAKQRNNYYIYYRANVKNPRMENELSNSGDKQFMELGCAVWGFPGLLKHIVREDGRILYNTLMLCDGCYKTEEEAMKSFNGMKDVSMKRFYNELFGNG
ncbi:MAG: hypothetical protein IJY83_09030 [Oscillospiraceae bacterium]|nr:hypothetical protein [Clostridia bacterium]MBQ8728609.1 hypothetical protein [Oscillospiraceae bacterium]